MYLIVRGEAMTLRRNILVSLEFPPKLICPEVTVSPKGFQTYHISCNIVSHPQIPRENITWEFLGKDGHICFD